METIDSCLLDHIIALEWIIFYQFNMCNLVLRKSVASHFSKGGGGMSQIKLWL